MWGRAQRGATRRCASDWGHNLGKGRVKIPLVATSRVRNISLHRTRSVDRWWVNLRAYDFFISGPERGREERKGT